MSEKDMLKELWEKQEVLNLRIGVDTPNLTEEEQIQGILNYCRAMTQELAELTDSVPWKTIALAESKAHRKSIASFAFSSSADT